MNLCSTFPGHVIRYTLVSMLLLAGLQTASAVPPDSSTPLDRVAAIVNDDVITETEIQARLKLVISNLKGNKAKLPPQHILHRQVLDSLVLERIQVQRARETGIVVSDDMLDQAFSELASQNKMTGQQFRAAIQKDGISITAFRDQLRSQTAIRQLVDREVNSRIRISEQDVDAYMRKREQQQNSGVEYNISHIVLTTPENASQSVIKHIQRQAEQIFAQINTGSSFETLAIANSKDQYALQGGVIGWKATAQLPELFIDALRQLKPGQVSAVLKSANGFHILKLNDKRGGAVPSFRVTQTHTRHILIKRVPGVSDNYIRRRLVQIRQRISDGEDFAKLARVHSDDVASAVEGGDLGWVTPGTTVPRFEQTMNRLKPGEISQIVDSPYGYHIIQVLARRQTDLGEEKLRADTRRELHVRKAEEYYQAWIRKLRDQAYVEYLG